MQTIVIIEEQALVRWSMRQLLKSEAAYKVVGEAADGAEGEALLARHTPDLALMGLALSRKDGFELLRTTAAVSPKTRVIIYSQADEPIYGARARASGAAAYVTKVDEPEQVLAAVRAVARGIDAWPAEIVDLNLAPDAHPAQVLSEREREVMGYLARGYSNREIASSLAISIKTVDTHRGHVLKKLQLRNNSDLTRFAILHGYIAPT